jgi:hypothetical protein
LRAASPSYQAESWDALERFLHQLPQLRDTGGQLRLTLEMIRSATRSDVVLLYTGSRREVSEVAGLPHGTDLAPLAALVGRIVPDTAGADGQALADAPLLPGSAALIRLSRSRAAWIIALRRAPAPALAARELRLMSLARKMLQRQQQQQDVSDQLRQALFSLVRCLTATLDARDPYTCGHSERVARISVRLGEAMCLGRSMCGELHLGGLLHDIGKIGVPDGVLRKPGKLTDDEQEQIRQHPVIGDAILAKVPQLAYTRPMVRSHHEQWDGRGYPDGLAGEAIPLTARVMAVADSCDAMMSDRPYRPAMPAARIEQVLTEGAGTQWDPAVIAAWMRCKEEVLAIQGRGVGDSVLKAIEHSMSDPDGQADALASMLLASPETGGRGDVSSPR